MLLSCEHITKFHNEKCILKDASFSIHEGDKVALIGINGAGKTTFLRILAGLENYQEGTIIKKNGLRISYLSQVPELNEANTVFQQVMNGYDKSKGVIEEFEAKTVLTKLGFQSYDDKISILSGGQRKRVALACVLVQPCDLLILDEPTNHLDNNMVAWLESYLMKYKGALLMVTHDRYFMDRITNKIVEIDTGSLYRYDANYTKFVELKAEREEMAAAGERKRKSILKKELEWIRAGVQARGTKSKERIARFHQLNDQTAEGQKDQVKLDAVSSRLGKKTIEFHNLSKAYDDHLLFRDFEYHMKRNDRIGILGPNGCGKSTLLHVLSKQIEPTTGEVIYGETVKLGYYKQMDEDMDVKKRVIDYIKDTSNEVATAEGTFSATQMLERFLFPSQLQYQLIERLSGGEKRRLYLLKILMQAPNILFLDEPTNDLDIQTLQILEDYLDQFNGAIIVVSHDRYFLDRICDKLFVFQTGGTIRQYIGGYSMFIETQSDEKTEGKERSETRRVSIAPRMSTKEKQELANMETLLEKLQSDIDKIDEDMASFYDDFKKIEELSKKREIIQTSIEAQMERWMYLEEKKQELDDFLKRNK